ncbi:MAG: hypothetical protein GKR89_04680 [Candidatus Latescibacteria bacterium]|nr:hypothetical protein [Candidatus Latescibacterota bacterium]
MSESTHDAAGFSLRSVLTGALLVGAISLLSPWAILIVKGSQLTSNAIPIIAVLFLFLLTLVAMPLLRLLGRNFAYSRAELIVVYAMMLVGSVVVTTGFTGSFLSVITGASYYATPENNWSELFVEYLPQWLVPADPTAIRLFYEGLPKDAPVPWAAWFRPLVAWTAFILIFYWVIFCLGSLLRGQWVENERLLYPLTRLPLAMLEEPEEGILTRLFKNRLMWIGFAVPLILHSWNSLNYYHDAFQPIALTGSVSMLQGLIGIPFRVNLPVMGLAYLMALNVSFSIWFFFLFFTIQRVIFARLGLTIGGGDIWTSGGGSIPVSHQQAGGMLVLALFVLWTARGHLRRLWNLARQGQRAPGEILSPRLAILGLGTGIALMLAWLTGNGLSFYVALLLVAGALLVFIGLSRIVCESGVPGCQTPMAPQAFITRGFGPEVLGLQNMTGLGLSTVWMGETAANMMNAVMHSLKLTSTGDRPARRLPLALLIAIVVGLAGSIWFTMTLAYTYGGVNLHGWYFVGAPRWPFTYMASVYNAPEPTFMPRATFTGIGALIMGGLLFLRQRFVWWPLHPLGFPVAATYTIVSYGWFAIFMAWLFKAAILRYGGVRTYRTLMPFFLGLILGEFSTACLWVFIDGYFGIEGNMIFNF